MVELTDEEYALITDAVLMLEEAIQRVRELHYEEWGNIEWNRENLPNCYACSVPSENYYVPYPCSTIKITNGLSKDEWEALLQWEEIEVPYFKALDGEQ